MITLKTLAEATRQEVFDQAAAHLLRQNAKSRFGDVGACAYRGDNGLMCAAGCFISDDEYREEMDNYGDGADWGINLNKGLVPDAHCGLISELQDVHDSHEVHNWENALIKMAEREGLEFKEAFV
jgi:hypothetical protein